MDKAHVLVFGCSDTSTRLGLTADEKAVRAKKFPVTIVSTGSAVRDEENIVDIVEATPSSLQNQIDDHVQNADVKAVKIGALFSVESVGIVSNILQQYKQVPAVIDVEPIFKTGPAPEPEVITALRKDILPSITILSATVPEVKALLDEAGITANYPKSIGDVAEMAKSLRSLGPKYVLIKREIVDAIGKKTTLHFVLCGDGEPLIVTSTFENPKGVTGASYSIPPVIAANLANGQNVSEATSAAFKFVEELIRGDCYFD